MKYELISLSLIAVVAVITFLDFTIYLLKSGAKRSYFPRIVWLIGSICWILLTYWYLNGMRFLYII